MNDPLGAVAKVSGIGAAAKLRDRLYFDMEDDAKTPDFGDVEKHDRAIGELEARFPELKDVPPGQGAEYSAGLAAARSKKGYQSVSTNQAGGNAPRKPAQGKPGKTGSKGKAAAGSKPARRSSGGGRSRRGSTSTKLPRSVRRGIEQTGLPGAARTGSELAWTAIGVAVGVSLVYVILTHPRRLEFVLGTFTTGLQRFLDPHADLFTSAGAAGAAGAGANAIKGAAGSVNPLTNPAAKGPIDPRKRRPTPSVVVH